METIVKGIAFKRIKRDINGNPRYVTHFLNLVNEREREEDRARRANTFGNSDLYTVAIKRANKLGGRKYHNKQYGGGIVFQSYNLDDLAIRIKESVK